jgi:ribosomal protein S30
MKAGTRTLLLGTMLAVAVPAVLATAQPGDPVLGTWALNVAQSKYSLGPAPKSLTRTYTAAAKGYKFSSKGVDAEGKPTATEFTAAFDGKFHPVTGNPSVDSIMVKRIDANTVEATQTKAGKLVSQTTRVVSKDGKTLTSTAKGKNAAGKSYTNVEVYDKR